MRPEETLADVVGIIVVIRVAVVAAVVGCPIEHRIFKGTGTENEREKPYWPFGFEGQVREQPVIPQRNAHSGCDQVKEKHRGLEPIHPVMPKVERSGDQSAQCYEEKKDRVDPINPIPGDIPFHIVCSNVPKD